MSMFLKPFRQYDEADVVNLYSLVENSGDAGDLCELVSMNPSALDGFGGNISPFAGIQIPRKETLAKVRLATSGSECLVIGMSLWNVRESDALGRPLQYDYQRWAELQVVYSGQTLPVLTRGIVHISGFTGTPGPGSGIGVDSGGAGRWSVLPVCQTPNLGKFLSSTGADGAAIAFLNIK